VVLSCLLRLRREDGRRLGVHSVLRVERLLGGRRDGRSGDWVLAGIWVSAWYVTLCMPVLALRRLLILRVLHHLWYGRRRLSEGYLSSRR
jgi:hypothetical protein